MNTTPSKRQSKSARTHWRVYATAFDGKQDAFPVGPVESSREEAQAEAANYALAAAAVSGMLMLLHRDAAGIEVQYTLRGGEDGRPRGMFYVAPTARPIPVLLPDIEESVEGGDL